MSGFCVILTRDDPEDDAVELARLGPFEGYAYIDRDGVSADSGMVASHDGVNPGYWIWPDGKRQLVEADGFRIEAHEPNVAHAEGVTATITRSAGKDRAPVVFVDGPDEADWMPDGSPRMRILLNDSEVYKAVPYEHDEEADK